MAASEFRELCPCGIILAEEDSLTAEVRCARHRYERSCFVFVALWQNRAYAAALTRDGSPVVVKARACSSCTVC